MIITREILVIVIATAIVSAIGFKKYIWFFSIGYGLGIATIGIMLLILFSNILNTGYIIASILLIVFGLRLGGYLLFREWKSVSYVKKMSREISDGNKNIFIKSIIWISCVILYFLMTSPIIYRFVNNSGVDTVFYVGIIVMVMGIVLEIVADIEKKRFKKINPNRFCDKGVYRIVRCPNYLGELIIWLGVLISGITALDGFWQWFMAILGYIGIVYVMFSGTKRIEERQDKTYGNDREFREYIKKTPIIIPFIPLYSVKGHKWLVA